MTTCDTPCRPDSALTDREMFDPVPMSARAARQFVRVRLEGHGVEPDAAEQVISELVANVVEHAGTPIQVGLHIGDTIRLEVSDGNSIVPAVMDAAADAERGRGLAIVEMLALNWGVSSTQDGKMIWVELER